MRIKFHIIGFCLFACLQKVGKRDIICSFHNAALFYVLNIKRLCVCNTQFLFGSQLDMKERIWG